MAQYTLYGINASTYVRTIRMLLHEKGVDYEQVPVDITAGENRTAEHRSRHPFDKIPTLQAGDVNLFESQAIAELIEARHPVPPMIPADAVHRAKMRQWISVIENYSYSQIIGTLVRQRVVNPMVGQPVDEGIVERAMPHIDYHFALLDEALGASKYLAGPELSLADLFLAPIAAYVSATPEGDGLFRQHRYVHAWYRDMAQRASFTDTAPM